MEIKTWADFGALSEEDRSVYAPEELEELKTSIAENEAKTAEDLEKKDEDLAKAKELAENYKIRAEKAEKSAKEKGEVKMEDQSLTTKDALALVNAKVSDEDYDEVIRVSKVLGKTIVETLKDKTMQTILSEREEERRTAALTQVGKNQGRTTKNTGEELLDKAEKTGEVPEDEEGMKKLFQARLARKIKG